MTVFRLHVDYDNNSDFKEFNTKAQNISRSLKRSQAGLSLTRAVNDDKE